jgi:hypothetical protein
MDYTRVSLRPPLPADSPQVQEIDTTPLNVDVLGVKFHEKEGKQYILSN